MCFSTPRGQFRAWRNSASRSANAASGRLDDKALHWVKQAEAYDDVTDEQCAAEPPKQFKRSSRALATALQKIAAGELGRAITDHVARSLADGHSARGLELLRMLFRYNASSKTKERVYRATDLQKV